MHNNFEPVAKAKAPATFKEEEEEDDDSNEMQPIMGSIANDSEPTLALGTAGSSVMGTPIYKDGDSPEELKSRFVANGYKDVWALVLFAVQIVATLAVAAMNFSHLKAGEKTKARTFTATSYDLKEEETAVEFIVYMLGGAAAAATGLAVLSLGLMRAYPYAYLLGANLLNSVLFIGVGIWDFSRLQGARDEETGPLVYRGVIMVFLGVAYLIVLYCRRRLLQFSSVILETAVTLTTRHYGSVVTSFFSLFVLVGYTIAFSMMTTPIVYYLGKDVDGPQDSHAGRNALLVTLLVFVFYWTTQVIFNVVHVTACGTVATWYFAGEQHMPRNPSLASLKRAVTTSFGSICLGSMIVALLKMILAMLRSSARNSRAGFMQLVALCFLGCVERLVEMFNVYAFSHVAIYGSSFVDAAKQTWELVQNCGFTGIINDCMIYNTLSLTNLVCSILIGVAVGVHTSNKYGVDLGIALGLTAFFISTVIFIVLLRVVYAGTVTLFVCYAENQEVASTANPYFAEFMRLALVELAPRESV